VERGEEKDVERENEIVGQYKIEQVFVVMSSNMHY